MRLFDDGSYEEAIEKISQSQTVSDEEFKQFISQCNHFITEQYIYLIQSAIEQNDVQGAVQLYEEYKCKHGENETLQKLVAPFIATYPQQSQLQQPSQVPSYSSSTKYPDDKRRKNNLPIIIAVVAVVFVVLIIISVRSCTSSSYDDCEAYPEDASYDVDEFIDSIEATMSAAAYDENAYDSNSEYSGY
jgi:hypothetical protein